MIPLILGLFHVLGLLTSIRAILNVRTAQGTIAWAVSLNTFPYLAVPAYWVFGRSTFEGYVMLRRERKKALTARQQEIARDMDAFRPPPMVDDSCGIGTATFGNRSFRLNFEITMLFAEPVMVQAVEKMFETDFARSTRATAADYTARPWWFRLAARTCRLMAPVQ